MIRPTIAKETKQHCRRHPACRDCPLAGGVCVAPSTLTAPYGSPKWAAWIDTVNDSVRELNRNLKR